MRMISTSGAPRPAGHYAQAVVHNGLVYVSGQLPVDPTTRSKQTGPIREQAALALRNLAAILQAAGSSVNLVLKVTVYISDIRLWDEVNAVYADFFGSHRPARAVVPTRELHYGFQVEIDAIAAVATSALDVALAESALDAGSQPAPAGSRGARAQCLVTRGNRLLMVMHREQGREWWCLPGGAAQPHESPAEAALRELQEECGMVGRIVRQTGTVVYSPAADVAHTFLVDVGDQEPRVGRDPELAASAQVLHDARWLGLAEIPERDRCFLWAAGLLGVGEFLAEVGAWGSQVSYPIPGR